MDIIIKTGFQNIRHNINFRPQTEKRGKNLAVAGHVRDVHEYRRNEISYLITANVIRQMNVQTTDYAVKLQIDAERLVKGVSCNCVYNQSECCKHVAALIYYINNIESFSKTSFEQQWGKPSARQFAQDKYSKGRYFAEMFPPPKKVHVQPRRLDVTEFKEPSVLRSILIAAAKGSHEIDETISRNAMLSKTIALENEKCKKCLEIILDLCGNQNIYSIKIVIEKEFQDFYKETIVLSRDMIVQLCCDTLKQSNCEKWFAERRLRISASKNVHSIKTRKTKTIESLVDEILFPKRVETPAMHYGRKHEKNACKVYQQSYNVSVQNVGLIVHEQQPWLCASPDGVIMRGNTVEKIVEFKCPMTCAKLPIVDYELKKCNVSYLKINEKNEIYLKESSLYYMQCQVQMYVTGTTVCDLFIYTPVKNCCCCVTISRNNQFLHKVIPKCELFYFENCLPVLYQKIIVGEKIETPKRTFTGISISNIV